MIKGLILDVDGVIVGERIGFNSPWPHPSVINALRAIREGGVYICLITAKPHFAIDRIIKEANLANPHVTDGGSVVIESINNVILKKHVIDKNAAAQALRLFLDNDVYVEFYTVENYYIQANQVSDITKKHSHVLQKEPVIVTSLLEQSEQSEIIKIMPIANNIPHSKQVTEIFKPLGEELNLYWAVHPVALPLQFGIVVPWGISKTEGIREMAHSLNLSFEDMLGVGDSTSDWQFIQLCKYGAAMGNANQELKDLVRCKGSRYSFVGPSVDDNGILEVFKYFGVS